jgi:hypothetical protein
MSDIKTATDIWTKCDNGVLVTEMSTWGANDYIMPDGKTTHLPSLNMQAKFDREGETIQWTFRYKGLLCKVFND